MSKVTTQEYPKSSSGSISINGQNKASTYTDGSTVRSNYNMNDYEKELYNYTQQALLNYLPKVNTFSDDTLKSLQSQLDAYTKQGIQKLNDIYTPMLNNLKNDIASRFGNLDNSMFMNNLNKLENNKISAVNSLVESILSKQTDFYNDELSNRYNYLNLLNTLQNSTNSNILNYLNTSLNATQMGNNYNENMYNAMFEQAIAVANYNLALNKLNNSSSKSSFNPNNLLSLINSFI